jgi:hypothetical protein
LGLGACTVRVVGLLDELGEPLAVPGWSITKSGDDTLHVDGWQNEVTDLQGRVELWNCSQQPVAKLRYPRAAEETISQSVEVAMLGSSATHDRR